MQAPKQHSYAYRLAHSTAETCFNISSRSTSHAKVYKAHTTSQPSDDV